jgi:hypothetical protein
MADDVDRLADDGAFLTYVLWHSETPRHAFHIRDANRLMKLAGVEEMQVDNPGLGGNFVGIDQWEGKKLVELAQARLKEKKQDG